MQTKHIEEFIESKGKFGMKLGLERIQALLNELGDPQNAYPIIHIGGTNGKGSTAKILETILSENDYLVGAYSSPSLVTFRERIRVGEKMISEEEVDEIFKEVKQACERLEKKGIEYPTGFEIETAMAFLYFKKKNIDLAIVEVGLGGRLDATNAISPALLTVITTLGFDHTQFLGESIEEIATEKAGIIKEGTTVLLAPQNKETTTEFLENKAYENGAIKVEKAHPEKLELLEIQNQKQILRYPDFKEPIEFNLLGSYQRKNLSTVLSALPILSELGFPLEQDKTIKALGRVTMPGRLEIFSKDPFILLDGAHNKEGIEAFSESLQELYQDEKFHFLFGMIDDKNYQDVVKTLIPIADSFTILTPDHPNAIAAADLKNFVESQTGLPVETIDNLEDFAFPEGKTVVTGSLYLIGRFLKEMGQLTK